MLKSCKVLIPEFKNINQVGINMYVDKKYQTIKYKKLKTLC